jgi:hypothetical protein
MNKLNQKYVLHIPCYKHDATHLIKLDMETLIGGLISKLEKHGYESLYMSKVKGYYKTRCFDEILLTIFTSSNNNEKTPAIIFKEWFIEQNNILEQEAYAYEENNNLIIEEL